MSVQANTSRVFDAQRKAKALLLAQSWTTAKTFDRPAVVLSQVNYSEHAEVVHIVPSVGDDSEITWRSMPNGRDEVFNLDIVITSAAFGPDEEDAALDRIEELADIVQRAFYDDTTGTLTPLDLVYGVRLEGVGQVTSSLGPPVNAAGEVLDHSKLIAQSVVTYRLKYRI